MPQTVRLPADAVMIDAAHLRAALGASRAKLSLWRQEHGFPPSYRDGRRGWTFTAAVAEWCRANGCEVRP